MKTSKNIKIVIADDHPLFREGIKSVFSNSSESIDIVGEAENGEEAYSLVLKVKNQKY